MLSNWEGLDSTPSRTSEYVTSRDFPLSPRSVWLASQASATITRSGKNALRKKRFTLVEGSSPFPGYLALSGEVFGARDERLVQYAHVGEIPVLLIEIQSVADDETVRNLEPHVADGHVDLASLRLREERADLERGGLTGLQVANQIGEGQPRVDDVLDDEHVAPLDVHVEVLEDPDDARRLGRPRVAGDRHEVDLAGNGQVPHQVAHEEHRALEDADEQQVLPGVVVRDLFAELGDPTLERLFVDQRLADRALELSLRHAPPSHPARRRSPEPRRPRPRAPRAARPRVANVGSWRRRTRLGSSSRAPRAGRPGATL